MSAKISCHFKIVFHDGVPSSNLSELMTRLSYLGSDLRQRYGLQVTAGKLEVVMHKLELTVMAAGIDEFLALSRDLQVHDKTLHKLLAKFFPPRSPSGDDGECDPSMYQANVLGY